MTSRPMVTSFGRARGRKPSLSAFLIGAATLLSALLVGVLLAANVPLGVGLLIALCYGPLVLINLPAGLAIWVGLLLVQHLQVVSIAPNAAAIVVAVGWVGTLGSRGPQMREVLGGHRRLIAAVALLMVWGALSPIWATDPSQSYDDIGLLLMAAAAALVVATTVSTPAQARLVLGAFVLGAALSVAVGIFQGGLASSSTAIESAATKDGRFTGGSADPNYLAASLVPAIVLAATLIGQVRNPIQKWSFALMIVLMGFGLAASQSRGGLIAAGLAALLAVVLYKRRAMALLMVGLVLLASASFFAISPGAITRVTELDGGGTGRSDLWRVGWLIFKDHPVTGVGLDNFRSESFRYVREPGNLEYVRLIAERPVVVHNTYLEFLVETGVVGLVLFLAVITGCLRAGLSAARRFEALGQKRLAQTARSVVVATVGMLGACFFLSIGADLRLWILFGMGPALLAMAKRQQMSYERPAV